MEFMEIYHKISNFLTMTVSYTLHALFFFTRIPVGLFMTLDEKTLIASRILLPVVGLILGGLLALIFVLFVSIFPKTIAIFLTLFIGVLLTGGFHEDAFADTADAFGGGYDKKSVLTIMKDSRVGTYGSLALIFSFGIAYLSWVEIPMVMLPRIILLIAIVSRFSALPLMWYLPYLRHDSFFEKSSKAYKNTITGTRVLLAGVFSVGVGFFLLGWVGVMLFSLTCVVSCITGWYYQKRLGGATGDCFGATIKLSELTCYVLAVLLV